MTALETHPDAFNVLLVDSEGPMSNQPKQHLEERDGWNLPDIDHASYQLMVQMMEAWLVADIDALSEFYGQGFNANSVPKNPNVEQIGKNDLEAALKEATRNTSKGKYRKAWHGPKLLEQLNVSKVRKAASYCDRLFTTLAEKMDTPT